MTAIQRPIAAVMIPRGRVERPIVPPLDNCVSAGAQCEHRRTLWQAACPRVCTDFRGFRGKPPGRPPGLRRARWGLLSRLRKIPLYVTRAPLGAEPSRLLRTGG